MPELKKVEIETSEVPQPQPTLAETQTQMAVAFGQMTETNRQLMERMNQTEAQNQSTSAMLTEALQEIRALRSQTDFISHREEQLSESQAAITSVLMENSEKDENQNPLEVTPMETHIEIDQKPANTKKSWIQKVLFG